MTVAGIASPSRDKGTAVSSNKVCTSRVADAGFPSFLSSCLYASINVIRTTGSTKSIRSTPDFHFAFQKYCDTCRIFVGCGPPTFLCIRHGYVSGTLATLGARDADPRCRNVFGPLSCSAAAIGDGNGCGQGLAPLSVGWAFLTRRGSGFVLVAVLLVFAVETAIEEMVPLAGVEARLAGLHRNGGQPYQDVAWGER